MNCMIAHITIVVGASFERNHINDFSIEYYCNRIVLSVDGNDCVRDICRNAQNHPKIFKTSPRGLRIGFR